MFLLDIEGIDNVTQNFTATLSMAFRWQDPSLAHDGPYTISVPLDEIWYPNLLIPNK